MKHFLLLLLLLSLTLLGASAQSVKKFRVVAASSRNQADADWSTFEKRNVLAVMNTGDMSFTFYAEKTLRYDVLHTGEIQVDKDGDKYCIMDCIDNDGDKTTCKMVFFKDSDRKQLYFFYPNQSFCYEIRSVGSNDE